MNASLFPASTQWLLTKMNDTSYDGIAIDVAMLQYRADKVHANVANWVFRILLVYGLLSCVILSKHNTTVERLW